VVPSQAKSKVNRDLTLNLGARHRHVGARSLASPGEKIGSPADVRLRLRYGGPAGSSEFKKVQMRSLYKSTSVTHRSRAGESLTREVRWYPANRQAYRWSEQEKGWVYLGHTDSLDEAKHLAAADLYNARRRDN
jgi:hypothetical protein